jgi:hypothetical protein
MEATIDHMGSIGRNRAKIYPNIRMFYGTVV